VICGKSRLLKGLISTPRLWPTLKPGESEGFFLQGLKVRCVRPIIAKTFALSDIQDCHRFREANQQIGKIVVTCLDQQFMVSG